MNNMLLWIGGLLVAALSALVAVPYFIDWNSYRGVFEEEASRLLGREVRVAGTVSLRFLPSPYVSFEKVRVADATGPGGEPFFRAESFTLWLAASPLLKGAIEANQVELKRPTLALRVAADGQGNWQSLKISTGALPFVPTDVALKSVRISNGLITVQSAVGAELARIDEIDGDVAADALEGPYKFRADVKWNGEAREVRGSTARAEVDGLRFKLAVRVPANGNGYGLDGKLVDAMGRPRVDGELTARFPFQAEPGASDTSVSRLADGDRGAFDLKAGLNSDINGLKLRDIAFAFEQDGKPQLLSGGADVDWSAGLDVKAELASRWLDLEKLASGGIRGPLEAGAQLVPALADLLPGDGRGRMTLAIDQISFGGEIASGIRLELEKAPATAIALREFRAMLPGGTRAALSGTLTGAGPSAAFDGNLVVRGANLGRFLGWAAKGQALPEAKGDSAFALRSRLMLTASALEFRDAVGELAGTPLSAVVKYRWEGRKQLSLMLDGRHLDLSAIAPGPIDFGVIGDLIRPNVAAGNPRGLDPSSMDVAISVRADRITDGDRVLHDVDIDLALEGGALRLPMLRFATGAGLELEIQGGLNGRAKGQLHGVIAVGSAQAANELSGFLDRFGRGSLGSGRLAGLTPFRIAHATSFGARGAHSMDISLDGTVMGNRVEALARLDGGFMRPGEAPIDVTMSASGPATARLLRLALQDGARPVRNDPATDNGRLSFKIAGSSAADLMSVARLDTEAMAIGLSARASHRADGALGLSGELTVKAADLDQALSAAGERHRSQLARVSLDGTMGFTVKDGGARLEARGLSIAGSPLAGAVTLTPGRDLLRIDGSLSLIETSVSRLLSGLLDGRATASMTAARAEEGPWGDEAFDLATLEGLEGRLRLEAGQIALADNLSLGKAVIEAEFAPGRVEIKEFKGTALGGTLTAALSLDKASAGANVAGTIRLAGARLDTLAAAPGMEPPASGGVEVRLEIGGRAASPRSLITVLKGKGEIELTAARLQRLAPAAVDKAVEAVLTGRAEAQGDDLRRVLARTLAAGSLVLGDRKLALEVTDGALRVQNFAVEAPDGRVTNQTTVDLATLKVDSEWRIEPKPSAVGRAAGLGKGALPGVTVVYVGALGTLARIEPRISAEALERELLVRRMERDVEELEKLRRLDEARAGAEAERVKGQEAAAQPAAELPPPQVEAPAADGTVSIPGEGQTEPKRRQPPGGRSGLTTPPYGVGPGGMTRPPPWAFGREPYEAR